MSFPAFLQNRVEFDDDDPYDDPQFARDMAFQSLEPPWMPGHPDWFVTVYYDPAKFPVAATLERIAHHYAATRPGPRAHVVLPGHDYRQEPMSAAQLKRSSIVRYPLADETFRRRGFVSDVEVQSFRPGEASAETTYLAHNRAAVCFQLAMIEALLDLRNATAAEKAQHKTNLARLIGQHQRKPVPLVERDGVFLPCHEFWEREQIHFAYSAALRPSLHHGRRDSAGFCHATHDEIERQVQFELYNSHALFNGAEASALLLWQAQALAVLRKAAWRIEFFDSAALNAVEINAAEQRKDALQCLRDDPALTTTGPILDAFSVALEDYRDRYCGAVLEAIDNTSEANPYGTAFGFADYDHGLTTEQNVVAALHGSTYRPDFDPDDRDEMSEPINLLRPVAEWIDALKRQRYAVLDERIAGLLVAVFGGDDEDDPSDPQLSRFAPMIQDRLGDVVWTVIAAAILGMRRDGTSEVVLMIYDWTRDAAEPWAAERRADGVIAIRGPLLDFPLSLAAHWNHQAASCARKVV